MLQGLRVERAVCLRQRCHAPTATKTAALIALLGRSSEPTLLLQAADCSQSTPHVSPGTASGPQRRPIGRRTSPETAAGPRRSQPKRRRGPLPTSGAAGPLTWAALRRLRRRQRPRLTAVVVLWDLRMQLLGSFGSLGRGCVPAACSCERPGAPGSCRMSATAAIVPRSGACGIMTAVSAVCGGRTAVCNLWLRCWIGLRCCHRHLSGLPSTRHLAHHGLIRHRMSVLRRRHSRSTRL